MNCGVIEMDFEVGYPIDGHNYGSITGTAFIDDDAKVVGLRLTALHAGSPDIDLEVPRKYDDSFAAKIADVVEGSYKYEIRDALNEWSVSIAEQEWEPREAAE